MLIPEPVFRAPMVMLYTLPRSQIPAKQFQVLKSAIQACMTRPPDAHTRAVSNNEPDGACRTRMLQLD